VLDQELDDGLMGLDVVGAACETVAFILEDQVLDLGPIGAGGSDNLVGFALGDARVRRTCRTRSGATMWLA
jgi:hypothetical protein